jgi:hypothetical protein
MNPSSLASSDQMFKGFSYVDDIELNKEHNDITRARFHAIESRGIRDSNGAPVTKKGFFSSWMSNAKTFVSSKK